MGQLTHQHLALEDNKMEKSDKRLEYMTWATIIVVMGFCIRFNYKMYH